MKTHTLWLFIISTLAISCTQNHKQVQENKLETYFERYVVSKQRVLRIDSNTSEKDTISYTIGYDSLHRVVNKGNHQFYEYDSLGRISKEYYCVLSRDPTCSKPHIYFYEYSNGNLARIKHLNNFMNDSIPSIEEIFYYDGKNRLVKHVKAITDTFTYTYIGNDTCKHSELETYWTNDMYGKYVKVSRQTIFQYDIMGRKISETGNITPGAMSWRKDFFYDSNNRLVMKKDTSLDNYNREPYSCCILNLTKFKYDNQGRLTEEEYSTGSYDNPNPQFQRITRYQY